MIIIEIERLDGSRELIQTTNVIWLDDTMTLYHGDEVIIKYQVGREDVTQAGLESLWKIFIDDGFRKGIWTPDKLKTVVQ